ncbi:MAG: TlpA disulfide reductase family protein [Pyrinomonadaceae bacterium]
MRSIKNLIAVFIVTVAAVASASAQTSLASLSGGQVDIQAQRGKVVILALGASWLPLSNKQAEYTNVLAKRYTGKDVVVYFVATDSTNAKSKNFATNADIEKFVAGSKLNVPVLRDSDGTVTLKKFSVDQLPSFVILDKQGNVSGSAFGGIDPKFDVTIPISKSVDALL